MAKTSVWVIRWDDGYTSQFVAVAASLAAARARMARELNLPEESCRFDVVTEPEGQSVALRGSCLVASLEEVVE